MGASNNFYTFAARLNYNQLSHYKMRGDKLVLCLSKAGLLLIVLFYLGSISFFYHLHQIGETTILHSHPYKKSCDGSPLHSHTKSELQLIQHLSEFNTTQFSIPTISLNVTPTSVTTLLYYVKTSIWRNTVENVRLRAPPFVLYK